MVNDPQECDCVLLDNGVEAVVLERYADGDLYLEKEIPSSGRYPDYEQFYSNVTRVTKITYHANVKGS